MNEPNRTGPPAHECLALRYLDALDVSDLEDVAALWDEAGADPALEDLLCELNEGLCVLEAQHRDWDTSTSGARELLRQHVPGYLSPAELR